MICHTTNVEHGSQTPVRQVDFVNAIQKAAATRVWMCRVVATVINGGTPVRQIRPAMPSSKVNFSDAALVQQVFYLRRPWVKPHVAADHSDQLVAVGRFREFPQTGLRVREWLFDKKVDAGTSKQKALLNMQMWRGCDNRKLRMPVNC